MPTKGEWKNKLWYTYMMTYYTAVKNDIHKDVIVC